VPQPIAPPRTPNLNSTHYNLSTSLYDFLW
jgi:hypothetical protein